MVSIRAISRSGLGQWIRHRTLQQQHATTHQGNIRPIMQHSCMHQPIIASSQYPHTTRFILSYCKRSFSSKKPTDNNNTTKAQTLEETYSRKTQLEHILLRPSMYIGPTERLPPISSWVLQQDIVSTSTNKDTSSNNNSNKWSMQRQELSTAPALLKIFDEILVNASDNRLRHPSSCNRIDVTINRGGNNSSNSNKIEDVENQPYISISNNGKSIPIQIHKIEKCTYQHYYLDIY